MLDFQASDVLRLRPRNHEKPDLEANMKKHTRCSKIGQQLSKCDPGNSEKSIESKPGPQGLPSCAPKCPGSLDGPPRSKSGRNRHAKLHVLASKITTSASKSQTIVKTRDLETASGH